MESLPYQRSFNLWCRIGLYNASNGWRGFKRISEPVFSNTGRVVSGFPLSQEWHLRDASFLLLPCPSCSSSAIPAKAGIRNSKMTKNKQQSISWQANEATKGNNHCLQDAPCQERGQTY